MAGCTIFEVAPGSIVLRIAFLKYCQSSFLCVLSRAKKARFPSYLIHAGCLE